VEQKIKCFQFFIFEGQVHLSFFLLGFYQLLCLKVISSLHFIWMKSWTFQWLFSAFILLLLGFFFVLLIKVFETPVLIVLLLRF